MTREEFFELRARMDFERRQGVKVCAPGAAEGSEAPTPNRKKGNQHNSLIRAATKMLHVVDDDGEAVPVRSQKMRRVIKEEV